MGSNRKRNRLNCHEEYIVWNPLLAVRPLTRVQWVFSQTRNPFGEYHHDKIITSGQYFEQQVVKAGLTKRDVALVLNRLGLDGYDNLFVYSLEKGLVLKKNLRPVLRVGHSDWRVVRAMWYHGVNVYFDPEPPWTIYGEGGHGDTYNSYMREYEKFRCSVVVLRGLELLPEHWREVAEFLGYL